MSRWSCLSADHRGQVVTGSGLGDSERLRKQAEDRRCYLAGHGYINFPLVPQAECPGTSEQSVARRPGCCQWLPGEELVGQVFSELAK